ncbi:hypothetical protein JOB18_044264 [Solea senegalensis]|uniref:Uncharacterized protein n=1 Tax=Solea senegalensis TaxID=28829 RepID=A0AAV6RM51_SOLSE|nr:hypothetical protein JOB18_044264 [Solea senegalensis]
MMHRFRQPHHRFPDFKRATLSVFKLKAETSAFKKLLPNRSTVECNRSVIHVWMQHTQFDLFSTPNCPSSADTHPCCVSPQRNVTMSHRNTPKNEIGNSRDRK